MRCGSRSMQRTIQADPRGVEVDQYHSFVFRSVSPAQSSEMQLAFLGEPTFRMSVVRMWYDAGNQTLHLNMGDENLEGMLVRLRQFFSDQFGRAADIDRVDAAREYVCTQRDQ